jgi:hypothetical protein
MAQNGRKAVRAGDRVRGVDAVKTSASASPKKRDCGCGCNGERKQDQAPASTSLGNRPANHDLTDNLTSAKPAPRNKRADAALATKPTGRMLSIARRAALSGRGKNAGQVP